MVQTVSPSLFIVVPNSTVQAGDYHDDDDGGGGGGGGNNGDSRQREKEASTAAAAAGPDADADDNGNDDDEAEDFCQICTGPPIIIPGPTAQGISGEGKQPSFRYGNGRCLRYCRVQQRRVYHPLS